jgi:adenine-specific DNA-methyltransferase
MAEQEFINAGFTVVGTENNENKLLSFLKEHYPSVLKDNEIDLNELKAIAGLPIDEKVNGYGLNFVGRNVARAKYAQKTEQELRLNISLSKNIDTTQNLVMKGDNLDNLKILKNYYSGEINCIYIDPPYNTDKDEFVYPDRFDKEEAEVLGLANLSESDMERMEFSFRSKKSHNGWLSFMYPRLLLARDLLSKDGIIFISIDDNEQANLKLLCDDIFGEENFIENYIWHSNFRPDNSSSIVRENGQYVICYCRNKRLLKSLVGHQKQTEGLPSLTKNKAGTNIKKLSFKKEWVETNLTDGTYNAKQLDSGYTLHDDVIILNGLVQNDFELSGKVIWSQEYLEKQVNDGTKIIIKTNGFVPYSKKVETSALAPTTLIPNIEVGDVLQGNTDLNQLFETKVFDHPKPVTLLKYLISSINNKSALILDFFAGSGSSGQAVMELNKDGGNRKFIICQIDDAIKEDKPAYQFCNDNNLPLVISSITIERLNRAGEKIAKVIEEENNKAGLFDENKKQVPDIGYKVFDSVEAPKLEIKKGTIEFPEISDDCLSRIYNMIFSVGIDEPTQVPEMVVDGCIYKIGTNYYITNSKKISKDDFSNAIKSGKVFIDGWTASLNGTLQNFKEDVKIVF